MSGKKLLLEGLSDAVGFVGGALTGYWLGQLLGWNIFSSGYDNASIGAILLVGLGGGGGLHLARFWRVRQNKDKAPKP
ncbi:hypothetical protein B9Z47_04345 [Limnohabitans sp. 2KL-1]|jgi:hypothetical protein|uniref:hypothetical protein n=1 Tax=Limnohabitans sp. 2KL-1 TaxID=1100699 RepID=UPI000D35AA3E|nr:hypothetical protein [Limnohabitans sp. 2KL-1]PUE50955.1 hypothetical protein B9Z47_04345 [Limnohabitans sp. 2KL-1]